MTEEQILILTEAAIAVIAAELTAQNATRLRVGVVGGGCSGYQYLMDIAEESEVRPDDTTLEFGEVKIIIDPISASFLKGTKIDYVKGVMSAGFQFQNPNAKRTCGCGSSFG